MWRRTQWEESLDVDLPSIESPEQDVWPDEGSDGWDDELLGGLGGEDAGWDERWDEGLDDDLPDEEKWVDDGEGADDDLAPVLGEVLDERYLAETGESLDDALADLLANASPSEAFSIGKALQQIQRGAGAILADPAVAQVARSALPLAGGALGTVVGGPVGTAVGTSLGSAAARALPPGAVTPRGAQSAAAPGAGGSVGAAPAVPAAATGAGTTVAPRWGQRALAATQQSDVLRHVLAAALGPAGQRTVNGVPVASVLAMLSSVFGRAAAEADELAYLDDAEGGADAVEETAEETAWGELDTDADLDALYRSLLAAEDAELDDVMDAW